MNNLSVYDSCIEKSEARCRMISDEIIKFFSELEPSNETRKWKLDYYREILRMERDFSYKLKLASINERGERVI